MLELRADCLNFGKHFEYGKSLLSSLEKTIKQFSSISNQPKTYIRDYFLELRAKCNFKRNEIKHEVDQYFDSILKEIDTHEKDCESSIYKISEMYLDIEMTCNLRDWIKEYDTTSINEETRNRIIFESKAAKLKLEEQMINLKMKLLKNCNYRIEQKDILDKKKFGVLVVEPVITNNPEHILFNFTLKNYLEFKTNPTSVVNSQFVSNQRWYLKVHISNNEYISCYLKCDPDW
jgi:hypothetical protein